MATLPGSPSQRSLKTTNYDHRRRASVSSHGHGHAMQHTDDPPTTTTTTTVLEKPSPASPQLSPLPATEGELPHILRERQSIIAFLLSDKRLAEEPNRPTKKNGSRYRRRKWREPPPTTGFFHPQKFGRFVMLGQFGILALGWAFLVIAIVVGPIEFKPSVASLMQEHPKALVFVVVMISTVLASISSFLFSLSIRYTANIQIITRSLSIYQLTAFLAFLHRTPILSSRHPGWCFASVASLFVTLLQVASWTTLLMPTDVTLTSVGNAYDLDLRNDVLLSTLLSQANTSGLLDPTSPALHLAGIKAVLSGSAASGNTEAPMVGGWTFGELTGGLYPPSHSAEGTVSFSTFNQLGLSVTVQCQQRPLSSSTSPSLRVSHAAIDGPSIDTALGTSNASAAREVDIYRWVAGCDGGKTITSAPFFTLTNTAMAVIPCPEAINTPSSSFAVLVEGTGPLASFSGHVCDITPFLTANDVAYDVSTKDKTVTARRTETVHNAVPPTLIQASMDLLQDGFKASQNMDDHSIGRSLLLANTLLGKDGGNRPASLLSSYLKGRLEVSFSLFRVAMMKASASTEPGLSQQVTANIVRKVPAIPKPTLLLALLIIPISLLPLLSITLVALTWSHLSTARSASKELASRSASTSSTKRPLSVNGPAASNTAIPRNVSEASLILTQKEENYLRAMARFDIGDPVQVVAATAVGSLSTACAGLLPRTAAVAAATSAWKNDGGMKKVGREWETVRIKVGEVGDADEGDVGLVQIEYGEAI